MITLKFKAQEIIFDRPHYRDAISFGNHTAEKNRDRVWLLFDDQQDDYQDEFEFILVDSKHGTTMRVYSDTSTAEIIQVISSWSQMTEETINFIAENRWLKG
jgi:hypothetical protein